MTSPEASPQAHRLIEFIRNEIPLAKAMDLQLVSNDDHTLSLSAPLPPNVNDKGCAFGGSLVTLMTLNGWALVELALRQAGHDCDVFVGESTVRYLSPLWQDFRSVATLAPEADWDSFFNTLNARGKARIEVVCTIPGETHKPAATMIGRYVAKRRS